MRKQRTHYDKAFKDNAVKLSFERKNVSELAHELGISPALLYRWCKEYRERGESSFPGNGVRSREREAGRVAELEKRLKEAETERDILKKALGIISQLPVADWYDVMKGNTTAADAILDRLVHTSVRFELKGASLRQKKVSNQTENREND